MTPHRPLALLAASAALAAVVVPAASADSPVVAAPGATSLAAAGQWVVWAAPQADGTWRLVTRAPDGTVSTPAIAPFPAAPSLALGSDGYPAGRHLLAVYSREDGGDADLYTYDLTAQAERRVSAISSAAYDETAAAVELGRFTFVRTGGRRPGLYTWSGTGPARRLTTAVPRAIAAGESRVAYGTARSVVIRRLSGRGPAIVVPTRSRPTSITISRYRTTWLLAAGRVQRTPRYAGSGGPHPVSGIERADRALPATTVSQAVSDSGHGWYLDAAGLGRVGPRLAFAAAR